MKMIAFAFCASALFLSGCIEVNLPEQKYQETRLFEIPEPASALFPFPVEVLPFRSDSRKVQDAAQERDRTFRG